MEKPSPPSDLPLGLRERKKARTRAAIQEHALRLFREQGYHQTTVEQIAEAAEVSPSTFFRYFPTKEDVVLFDATDPIMLDLFAEQPKDITLVEALRRTLREVYSGLSEEQLRREYERTELAMSVPELRARALLMFAGTVDFMIPRLAERLGRDPDDPELRTVCGAIMGAIMGQYLAYSGKGVSDLIAKIDEALVLLEHGLTI
jgi:AcrR family transcriptional regulator